MLHHLQKKTKINVRKTLKHMDLSFLKKSLQLPPQQWRNNIPVFLEELEQIRRQSQVVAQRLHLSLWRHYKEPQPLINLFT